MVDCFLALTTSTTGDSPVTVIVSSTPPTRRSASTRAANEPLSSIPGRSTVANPGSLNLTTYVPGRRSSIRYWPPASVTVERTFSMSASLDASTVTPGSTAPDVSLTEPVIDAWASTTEGTSSALATTITVLKRAFIH